MSEQYQIHQVILQVNLQQIHRDNLQRNHHLSLQHNRQAIAYFPYLYFNNKT